jgi:hypothetical protein
VTEDDAGGIAAVDTGDCPIVDGFSDCETASQIGVR